MSKLHCHVISNTHWDREWRYPFQSYRMDLVDMMDRLLDLMEKRPDYRAFFLDSQTVILEDYLEIRPENHERISKLVKAGRLQIGPWYTLPDMWGCPGEALVRNLLMGHRTAAPFGRVSKTGYTPFSNGQISQLPQLYRGFGIDSCFFYRGIGKHVAKSEFIWEGPDGSQLFGFRFADYARYNYYYLLYRPGLLGRTPKDRDYQWNPEEIPYHVAVEQAQDRQYGWISPKLEVHRDMLRPALDSARNFTEPDATTSHVLYMMGHDHSFAAEQELSLIEALSKELGPKGEKVFHSSLEDYLKAFRCEAKDLQVVRGEMRHTLKEGLWTTLMALILSSRIYLKQQNARVNAKVLFGAEPLACCAWLSGSEYPARFLEIAWKKILINQAHDAIGGCSVDQVHTEMRARWGEVQTINDEICRRAMRDIASRIDAAAIASTDLQLTVFNTIPYPRTAIASLVIDVPSSDAAETFAIETLGGKPVPMQIGSREQYMATVEGGYELNMPFPVQRFRVKVLLEELPPLGYDTFVIRPGRTAEPIANSIVKSPRELENEFLHVLVNGNGTLRLTDKRTGKVFDKLCYFEDTAELGDPWNRVVPEGDQPLYSLDAKATVQLSEQGPLEGTLRVSLAFPVPVCKRGSDARASEHVQTPFILFVTLRKGSPVLEVTVHVDNHAKDHRVRVLFPSGISKAQFSSAEGQFDVLSRPIKLPSSEGWKEAPYPTHPMWNFMDVSDGTDGFALMNDGVMEYEVIDDEPRTVAITLLRAFGRFTFDRPTPGSQCLGHHFYRFGIHPHEGSWSTAQLPQKTLEFITQVQALESAPTKGQMPTKQSFLSLSPSTIQISGTKQSEDGKALIVRFWNPLDEPQEVTLEAGLRIRKAEILTLEEKHEKKLAVKQSKTVTLTAPKKKIITVALRF